MALSISPELLKGWKVVVVDDEADSMLVASTLLEMYGAEVITAENGREALPLIRRSQPRFVVSDLTMPEMSGWEMVRELKKERATMDIPIIALTAHALEGDRVKAIEAGFHNHLTKPLRPETFIADLLRLLIDIPNLAGMIEQ